MPLCVFPTEPFFPFQKQPLSRLHRSQSRLRLPRPKPSIELIPDTEDAVENLEVLEHLLVAVENGLHEYGVQAKRQRQPARSRTHIANGEMSQHAAAARPGGMMEMLFDQGGADVFDRGTRGRTDRPERVRMAENDFDRPDRVVGEIPAVGQVGIAAASQVGVPGALVIDDEYNGPHHGRLWTLDKRVRFRRRVEGEGVVAIDGVRADIEHGAASEEDVGGEVFGNLPP